MDLARTSCDDETDSSRRNSIECKGRLAPFWIIHPAQNISGLIRMDFRVYRHSLRYSDILVSRSDLTHALGRDQQKLLAPRFPSESD